MKIKLSILLVSCFLCILSLVFSQGKDDLSINFLPSTKYKINTRDLTVLKSDIERQLLQRVYEMQSNWDEREKLRLYATSRPPVIPPYPIPTPVMNIPVGGNAFHANLDFKNEQEAIARETRENQEVRKIEDKIAALADKKIQKELKTQITLAKQAIESLKKEIDDAKKTDDNKRAKITRINHNLPNIKASPTDKPESVTNSENKDKLLMQYKFQENTMSKEIITEEVKEELAKLKKAKLLKKETALLENQKKLLEDINKKKEEENQKLEQKIQNMERLNSELQRQRSILYDAEKKDKKLNEKLVKWNNSLGVMGKKELELKEKDIFSSLSKLKSTLSAKIRNNNGTKIGENKTRYFKGLLTKIQHLNEKMNEVRAIDQTKKKIIEKVKERIVLYKNNTAIVKPSSLVAHTKTEISKSTPQTKSTNNTPGPKDKMVKAALPIKQAIKNDIYAKKKKPILKKIDPYAEIKKKLFSSNSRLFAPLKVQNSENENLGVSHRFIQSGKKKLNQVTPNPNPNPKESKVLKETKEIKKPTKHEVKKLYELKEPETEKRMFDSILRKNKEVSDIYHYNQKSLENVVDLLERNKVEEAEKLEPTLIKNGIHDSEYMIDLLDHNNADILHTIPSLEKHTENTDNEVIDIGKPDEAPSNLTTITNKSSTPKFKEIQEKPKNKDKKNLRGNFIQKKNKITGITPINDIVTIDRDDNEKSSDFITIPNSLNLSNGPIS